MDNEKSFKAAVTLLIAAGLSLLFIFFYAILYH
jgi:cbb3-type cytochrome oxidase subunit 3